MPVTKSAAKALRVSKRKTVVNQRVRSRAKTAIKQMFNSPSADKLSEAFSRIDKAAKLGIIHKNTAARRKSRLAKLLKVEPTK